MQAELNLPLLPEDQLYMIILKAIESSISKFQASQKEWMSLKEGAAYANVSYNTNTFIKYRLRGLKVCEIDGVKRVSKTEIDNFLNGQSF